MMLRLLYSAALWLAQPLLRARLLRRGAREPGYLERVEERFGRYGPAVAAAAGGAGTGWLWVHAVSLGETRAAAVLLDALRERLPQQRVLLTHGTATGRTEGARLLRPGDLQVWQPWDTPGAVGRFLRTFRPRAGILMETEVWPNLTAACAAAGIPLVLANARLNPKSLHNARQLGALARPAYASLAAVWAQSEGDAQRLHSLGAPVRGVFGNLKFDATPDPRLLACGRHWRAGHGRPVVLFASSREGEESLWLQALQRRQARGGPGDAGVQWLVVPRHPQRFAEVAALIAEHGFAVSRRSGWDTAPPAAGAPAVWLGDSVGEMALYYGLADVALLGGSFAALGGQNLIEAAACGCPVVMGPHTFNFAEAAALAQAAGAARRVDDLAQAVDAATALAGDVGRQAAAAEAALQFAAAHRGAAARTAQAVAELLAAARR